MSDIMCCARCGHALKIVCPEHGTEFVPDRRMEALPPLKPDKPPRKPYQSAIRRGEVIAKPGSLTEAILLAFSDDAVHDASSLAAMLGRDIALMGVMLSGLAKRGRIVRISRGRYERAA